MKLSPLTIFIIGFSIAISVLSFAFFQAYLPNQKATEYWDAYRDQLRAEADRKDEALKRVANAKAMVQKKADEWRAVVAIHTPPPGLPRGINLNVNAYQLTVDSAKFRNNMQRELNAQLRRGGVKVISGVEVPQPGDDAENILANYYNYPALPFPVVVFDLGPVTVRGTYEQIMNHVRSYSSMPHYLAVTDGLSITGTAPTLTATYNLSIVGYIRGSQIFPKINSQSTTASNSPAPGNPTLGG